MSRSRSYTSSRTEKELLCCLPILFIYLITPFPTIFGSDWLTWLQLNPSFLDYETTNLCQIRVSHKRAELIPSMSKLNQNWAGAVPISQLSIWNSVGCVRAARCGGRTEYEQQLLWKSRVLFCFKCGCCRELYRRERSDSASKRSVYTLPWTWHTVCPVHTASVIQKGDFLHTTELCSHYYHSCYSLWCFQA